jgi:hypothetical protein
MNGVINELRVIPLTGFPDVMMLPTVSGKWTYYSSFNGCPDSGEVILVQSSHLLAGPPGMIAL